MQRYEKSKTERDYIDFRRKSNPELFISKKIVENDSLLSSVGIKNLDRLDESFYFKTLPSDFIVEEENNKFGQTDIEFKNLELIKDSEDKRTLFVTLVKCNIQTTDAIEDISLQLGIDISSISYAGLKDKKAITSQTISIRGVSFEKLKKIRSEYFFLKDAVYGNGIIGMGELVSNRFTIVLRSEKNIQENVYLNIRKTAEKVEKEGHYNFYYLQRFSAPRYTNMHWGYLIFKGRYEEAIKLSIVQSSEHELDFFRVIRAELGENYGNWEKMKEILEPFTSSFSTEKKLIEHLSYKNNDFVGALKTVPEQVRLWVYSVPSYFFNLKVSEIKKEDLKNIKTLPLVLSRETKDWLPYNKILEENDFLPVPLEGLRPFEFLLSKSRSVEVKSNAKLHKLQKINESSFEISFSLNKGEYATTYMSHIFVLIQPSEDFINQQNIDLENMSFEKLNTLKRFVDVLE